METPKKPVKKDAPAKHIGAQTPEETAADLSTRKRLLDDDDEDDFDIPLDDLGRYESFEGYDEDDDY